MLRSQRQAEEALRREQVEHNLRQVHEAMQKKAAEQAPAIPKPAPPGDAVESVPQ
jgi:hypothetical protein